MSRIKVGLIILAMFLAVTAAVLAIAWDAPPRCQTTKCLEGM